MVQGVDKTVKIKSKACPKKIFNFLSGFRGIKQQPVVPKTALEKIHVRKETSIGAQCGFNCASLP